MTICFYNQIIGPIIGGVALFLILVPFPIIFNKKIIPSIERRLGKKLIFNKNFGYYYLLPKTLQPMFWWMDVAFYFLAKIINLTFKRNIRMSSSALTNSGYDIRHSTRFEFIMSLVAALTGVVFFVDLMISAFFHYVYHC